MLRLLVRDGRARYRDPMTSNANANGGGSNARRRGRGAAIAGGGVAGLGGIAVLIFALLTGGSFDLSSLLGGGSGTAPQGSGDQAITGCETGAQANADDTCRLVATSVVLDDYWTANVDGYQEPQLIIVDQQAASPCGTASNATGPFYCPADQTVYIDPTFFGLLRSQFGASAGSLAQMYVLAHEYGHHVQNLIGVMDQYPNNGSGLDSNSVRTELQADCFAGAFISDMATLTDEDGNRYLQTPTEAQIRDALNAAATVGDDHIQQQSGGFVNPESWTHGSSEQRQRWFATGYQSGPQQCDTFAVSGGQL
jgi:predicted metalloprotease